MRRVVILRWHHSAVHGVLQKEGLAHFAELPLGPPLAPLAQVGARCESGCGGGGGRALVLVARHRTD